MECPDYLHSCLYFAIMDISYSFFVYLSKKRYISDAANKNAPTPNGAVEFWSTICPGIARSPIGCTKPRCPFGCNASLDRYSQALFTVGRSEEHTSELQSRENLV